MFSIANCSRSFNLEAIFFLGHFIHTAVVWLSRDDYRLNIFFLCKASRYLLFDKNHLIRSKNFSNINFAFANKLYMLYCGSNVAMRTKNR